MGGVEAFAFGNASSAEALELAANVGCGCYSCWRVEVFALLGSVAFPVREVGAGQVTDGGKGVAEPIVSLLYVAAFGRWGVSRARASLHSLGLNLLAKAVSLTLGSVVSRAIAGVHVDVPGLEVIVAGPIGETDYAREGRVLLHGIGHAIVPNLPVAFAYIVKN